jgi:hypothetical protein
MNQTPLKIKKELVVSIEHQPGRDFLESDACEGFEWEELRYGVRISTGSDDYPPELSAVVALAKEQGCDSILFDAAGPEVEGLPLYDRASGTRR